MGSSDDLYDIARQVTDEVLGEGTYAAMNADHHDPGVRAAIARALAEAAAEEADCADCDHRIGYGRIKKFDGGRLPILCGRCYHIVGWGR